VKPKLAVIFDIRRGNLDLQLMYKALFELSADRADFVSKLFARSRPAGLSPSSTAIDVFRAVGALPASEAVYTRTLQAIETHLTKTHAFPVPQDDLAGVRLIYEMFYRNGFAVRASPTYADLMTATDQAGVSRGYLADEASFQVMKDLESRNLVVPVVGDFGGPKAIRAIGAYLRSIGGTVSAFYLSNVEQYLRRANSWPAFCSNVATFPIDDASVFIRPSGSNFTFVNGPLPPGATGTPVVTTGGTTTVVGRLVQIRLVGGAPTGTAAFAGGLIPIASEVKNCGG